MASLAQHRATGRVRENGRSGSAPSNGACKGEWPVWPSTEVATCLGQCVTHPQHPASRAAPPNMLKVNPKWGSCPLSASWPISKCLTLGIACLPLKQWDDSSKVQFLVPFSRRAAIFRAVTLPSQDPYMGEEIRIRGTL
ncbi:hypothetical protein XENTR_v10023332 [Xenopus tropicalis]|nr:hypothetical protein XENTR_v10023332 [Xenopus tropicalis]